MKKHRPAEQRCSNEQTVCPWRKRKEIYNRRTLKYKNGG